MRISSVEQLERLLSVFETNIANLNANQLDELKKSFRTTMAKRHVLLGSPEADIAAYNLLTKRAAAVRKEEALQPPTPEQAYADEVDALTREHHVSKAVAERFLARRKDIKPAPPIEDVQPSMGKKSEVDEALSMARADARMQRIVSQGERA